MYQNRLEITSTGGLHFDLTPEKLFEPHQSFPWNPLIARVFHRRGIIESWGRGVIRMAELPESAGLPRPEIEESGGGVVVRFRPSRYIAPREVKQDLTEQQRVILQLIADRGNGLARNEIVKLLNQPKLLIRDDLQKLQEYGLIELTGRGRSALWFLRSSS